MENLKAKLTHSIVSSFITVCITTLKLKKTYIKLNSFKYLAARSDT